MSKIKSDLVDLIMNDKEIALLGLSNKEVTLIVSKFLDTLQQSIINLKPNNRIELRNLGTFFVRTSKARTAKNPKTGEKLQVPAKNKVHFKPGKDLKIIKEKI